MHGACPATYQQTGPATNVRFACADSMGAPSLRRYGMLVCCSASVVSADNCFSWETGAFPPPVDPKEVVALSSYLVCARRLRTADCRPHVRNVGQTGWEVPARHVLPTRHARRQSPLRLPALSHLRSASARLQCWVRQAANLQLTIICVLHSFLLLPDGDLQELRACCMAS
jgi:hypothetical protein